ncbi:acyl-CoA dehydrogenase family protein [Streptomyces brasiliensis]|uniref:Acyl-CoA dehydrogenase n=1 Tax=Streptomyces brasiliensis TaxID=1954 RepID=A0A917P7J0_9ACTN|nr:acyl-CoA dehydrogenase family protein [Streptomyces brasiliensis]GGJ65506.1 acyl-CoA dehydrogenase [Streptomyces brasiliensis]
MSAPLVTAPMTWYGPRPAEDEQDLLKLLDSIAADRGTVLSDDPEIVAALVAELAGLGVWTLAAAEEHGGGGAGRAAAVVVWERLGRYWPALGWASVQAHAALAALGPVLADPALAALASGLHSGTAAVAVLEARRPLAALSWEGSTVTGSVARLDAAHPAPHLLLLDGARCLLVAPEDAATSPVARTGLAGALTMSATIGAATELPGADAAAARALLRLGGAVVAAGIAGAAADTSAAYTASRRQFGGPLIDLPTVRRSVDEQQAWVRGLLAEAMGIDQEPSATAGLLTRAADGAIDVAAAALQSHGGYGYLTEYPVERYLRDAVSLRAATAS